MATKANTMLIWQSIYQEMLCIFPFQKNLSIGVKKTLYNSMNNGDQKGC